MGDRLIEEDKSKQTSPTPYGDIFDQCLPVYMSMGMTYDEFWDGEYGTKTAYRKAYRIRMETEQKLADRNNWYMGQYLIYVLHSVPLLVSGFNVKSSTRLPEYPNMPFLEKYEQTKREEKQKKHEEDQTKLAMALFQASIEKFNRNIMKREEAKQSSTGQ